jgi:hypothetical protein
VADIWSALFEEGSLDNFKIKNAHDLPYTLAGFTEPNDLAYETDSISIVG